MQIQYYHEFLQELEKLDKKIQKRIKEKLKELFRTPFSNYTHLALKGKQFKGLYKLRIGDWRLIYKLVGEEIHFITLGHRSEVYK
jgi:mRNA interferase RelE/StbE